MSTVINRLPFKIISGNDQTYESVSKRIKQLKKIVEDKRKRKVLEKDKKYTYYLYTWIFGGKQRFSYCDEHDWANQKKINGIKLFETHII